MGHQTNAAVLYARLCNFQNARGLDLMDAAAPAAGEQVLDLGCGPGILTRELTRRVGPEGRVVGIDPDLDRLELAELTKPQRLTNLQFLPGRGESLSVLGAGRWDLIYSNYVAHWIEGKQRLVHELAIGLKPGGRAAFEFCGEVGPFVEELLAEGRRSGQRLPAAITYLGPRAWRDLLEEAGLLVETCDLLPVTYSFADYPQFAAWWEGTTHGAIRAAALGSDYRARLEAYFEGGGSFDCRALRFLARKPSASA